MNVSLRVRVFLLVAALNAGLFTIGGAYLSKRFRNANDELYQYFFEKLDILGGQIRRNIDPEGTVYVGAILEWEFWPVVDDAILVGKENLKVELDGTIVPAGIFLNPVGSARRSSSLDKKAVLDGIFRAVNEAKPVPVEGGRALPILVGGKPWGGCWIQLKPPVTFVGIFDSLLPLFLLSTLVLTLATVWALNTFVLQPVRQLAQAARRLGGGDFSARLAEPGRRDEVADLVRTFNAMATTVQDFNVRLEEEVTAATEKARQAEAAAMTQRRLAAMGELAAGIAHEINNPLGGLQNAVTTLGRADLEPAKRKRYLELLSSGLQRIGETVSRLRRFTPREAARERFDLIEVMRDAIQLVAHRADRLSVRIEFAQPEGTVPVEGSRNEVGQALLNLLANALDALEDGGSSDSGGPRIDLTVDRREGGTALVVRDNGPGVPDEGLVRVSDLFYTTKEVGKGTGLGLALVHKTLTAMGGSVTIESEEGSFFAVELFFPAPAKYAAGEVRS